MLFYSIQCRDDKAYRCIVKYDSDDDHKTKESDPTMITVNSCCENNPCPTTEEMTTEEMTTEVMTTEEMTTEGMTTEEMTTEEMTTQTYTTTEKVSGASGMTVHFLPVVCLVTSVIWIP